MIAPAATQAPTPAEDVPSTLADRVRTSPAQPTNAARRLVGLLDRIMGQVGLNRQMPMIDVWRTLFALEQEGGPVALELEIARMLRVVLGETAAVRAALATAQIVPDAYEPHLTAVADLLSVGKLPYGVEAVCAGALATPRAVLHAFGQMLPVEHEPMLDEATLTEALAILRAMRVELAEDGLSPTLRTYFDRQLDRMMAAVREYPIRGAAAFRDAAEESVVALAMDGALPNARSTEEAAAVARWRERFVGWWQQFERVATRAVLIGDTVTLLLSGKPVVIALAEPPRQLAAPAEMRRLTSGTQLAPADATHTQTFLPSTRSADAPEDMPEVPADEAVPRHESSATP